MSRHVALTVLGVLVVAVFVGQVVAAFAGPRAERFADLQVYSGAVTSWLDGGSLYDYQRHNGDVFTYPPAAGYLLWWLGLLPTGAGQALWTALTFAAMVLLAHVLARSATGTATPATETARSVTGTARPATNAVRPATDTVGSATATTEPPNGSVRPVIDSRARLQRIALLLLILGSAPGRSNLAFGQVSIMVIALTAYDLLGEERRWSGMLLGVCTAVKLTPALFVPLLWWAGKRRQAGVAAGTALGLTGLCWAVRPADSQEYWLHQLPDGSRFVNSAIPGNQSLRACLERAHVPEAGTWWIVLCALVVACALFGGAILARRGAVLAAVVVVGAASVVVSPISWTHHQFWLLGAVFLPVRGPRAVRFGWRTLVVAVMLCGPVAVPGSGSPFWEQSLVRVVAESHLLLCLACVGLGLRAALRAEPAGPARTAEPAEPAEPCEPTGCRGTATCAP